MNVLVLFLVVSFIAGGARHARPLRQHPWWYAAGCAVVGASFYSLRVIS